MRTLGFVAVALFLSLILRAWCFETFRMPGEAMAPGIRPGDLVFVLKTPLSVPKARGAVVVFAPADDPESVLIRRVVALGGETVEMKSDGVYVNGARVPGPLGDRGELPTTSLIQVAPNEVFVMPDSRSPSSAHRLGSERVATQQLMGVARWVWFSTLEKGRWFRPI